MYYNFGRRRRSEINLCIQSMVLRCVTYTHTHTASTTIDMNLCVPMKRHGIIMKIPWPTNSLVFILFARHTHKKAHTESFSKMANRPKMIYTHTHTLAQDHKHQHQAHILLHFPYLVGACTDIEQTAVSCYHRHRLVPRPIDSRIHIKINWKEPTSETGRSGKRTWDMQQDICERKTGFMHNHPVCVDVVVVGGAMVCVYRAWQRGA